MSSDNIKKRIVVLGGGFGGLRAVLSLERQIRRLRLLDRCEIVLIDKSGAHEYTPLLYEIAAYSDELRDGKALRELVLYPYREILKGKKIRFVEKEARSVDFQGACIDLGDRKISYDYLVLGLGSKVNYFHITGADTYSFPFKTYQDALAVRSAVWDAYLAHGKDTRIVVGGAGPTGVELASEIKNWLPDVGVTLVEADTCALKGFHSRVRCAVENRLEKMKIRTVSNYRISEVLPHALLNKDEKKVPYDVFVWTAGVRAATLGAHEGVSCLPEGPDLKVVSRVYAIGDMSCLKLPKTGQSVPMLAQVALEQARVAARNIVGEIKKELRVSKKTRVHTFRPKKKYPYIVPVGGKYAVSELGPFVFKGRLAWILKGFVELKYLFGIMPPLRAFRMWWKGLVLFARNDRLG